MITKKGIILAGGTGSRLYDITKAIPKSLVPIYNKPTIYYSLTTLLEQHCNDILVICRSEYLHLFKNLLGDGKQFNINIEYAIQDVARGLADAYLIAKQFLNGQPSTMILGDNVFIGDLPILTGSIDVGCCVMEVLVKDASQYGVYDDSINKLIEKPKQGNYTHAIPGIYYFDGTVSERAASLKPSKRGEIEITDLIQTYLDEQRLTVHSDNNVVWFDTGTFDELADASNYIRFMENKFGKRIGDPFNANM